MCAERRAPKSRRVGSLPAFRAVGEQSHLDLLVAEDAVYVIAHATDAVSKFQQAAILPDKSAGSVVDFMATSRLPVLGAPRTIIADQGREFVAAEFQDWCSSHSILCGTRLYKLRGRMAQLESAFGSDRERQGRDRGP